MRKLTALVACALMITCFAATATTQPPEQLYYAFEQNGVVCGYDYTTIEHIESDGRPAIHVVDSLEIQLVLMGKNIRVHYRFEYLIDPSTGNFYYHQSDIDQGNTKMHAEMYVSNDSIRIVSDLGAESTVVALTPDVTLENARYHMHLGRDFADSSVQSKTYHVFSVMDATINDVTYTRQRTEQREYAGEKYTATLVHSLDQTTGVQSDIWIDSETGLLLEGFFTGRRLYLTDESVVDKVQVADYNKTIFAQVGIMISDPWEISYMKVKGSLQPGGMWVTEQTLNVPGQTFTGTVVDNQIDGIFEITHERYDGTNSPPFPCDFSQDEALKKYLEPSDLIESDDSAVVSMARKLTKGATTSWEAACKLSQWVYEEISYDLPGGVTAARTLEMRLGECGSHSNLLAGFCRAVGIPCRTVFGCMYVPNNGGAFGQHAWNEIYMGENGWIPVDATVQEVSYVDCGHIRLGEWMSRAAQFNPDTMIVLDYQLASATDQEPMSMNVYEPYVGEYQGLKDVFKVLTQNGSLAVDIPRQMVFELTDPDESGKWFFKLSNMAYVSFVHDSSGSVSDLTIASRQRLPKSEAVDTTAVLDNVSPDLLGCIGAYTLPMRNLEFAITSEGEGLLFITPDKKKLPITSDDDKGVLMAVLNDETYVELSFDLTEAGEVRALTMDQVSTFPKIVQP